MKTYYTQAEVEADIEDGVLVIEGDVTFKCDISIRADIIVKHGDINALDINANNINANNINAWDIIARDIKANNITAWGINANDISYFALCFAYDSITCASIEPQREVHQKPICLDGKLTIVKKKDDATEQAIQLLKSNGYKIIKD